MKTANMLNKIKNLEKEVKKLKDQLNTTLTAKNPTMTLDDIVFEKYVIELWKNSCYLNKIYLGSTYINGRSHIIETKTKFIKRMKEKRKFTIYELMKDDEMSIFCDLLKIPRSAGEEIDADPYFKLLNRSANIQAFRISAMVLMSKEFYKYESGLYNKKD